MTNNRTELCAHQSYSWPARARVMLALLPIIACTVEDSSKPLSGRAALVITTDYQTGSYAAVRLSDHAVVANIDVIHEDAVCRFDPLTGFPLIVARMGADAIDIIDPQQDWQVIGEYSVGAGSNAQDIAVASTERAYVSRLGEPGLLVLHPLTGDEIEKIDLTAYADADGQAEPAGLYHLDGKIYALLLKLEDLAVAGPSTMLVIDALTGTIDDAIELSARNPWGRLRYSESIGKLVLVEAGAYGDHTDGCVETYDPITGTLSGPLVTEQTLGGDLVDAVIASATKAYAIIGESIGGQGNTRIVIFNPSIGVKTGDLIVAESFDHLFLELTPDGSELWVPDRRPNKPGIRIFDVTDDHEITSTPIDVGLPPIVICFVSQH